MSDVINNLIRPVSSVTFTATTSTWVVPKGRTYIDILGSGAGGGGGGPASVDNDAGGGGAGATPSFIRRAVVPGETLTITIGAGGTGGGSAANGLPGGDSYITGTSTPYVAFFPGASGGITGNHTETSYSYGGSTWNYSVNYLAGVQLATVSNGGIGARSGYTNSGAAGTSNIYASGGAGGTGTGGGAGNRGGGGGGAGWGNGAAGGTGPGASGSSAAANSSAGGGGAASGGGANGGTGGSGKVIIYY